MCELVGYEIYTCVHCILAKYELIYCVHSTFNLDNGYLKICTSQTP